MKIIQNVVIKQKLLLQFSLLYLVLLIVWYFVILSYNRTKDFFILSPDSFYFEPFISTSLLEVINNSQAINVIAVINIIIIPYVTLILLFKVYSRFVEPNYAFLFSLLSLSVSNEKNFRDFLSSINELNIAEEFIYTNAPLIFKFPFPSLSILIFLILLYTIINIKKSGEKNYWVLTILSSSFFYINALDALFILVLWFFILRERNDLRYLIFHSIITLIILLPGLLSNAVLQNYEETTPYNYYNLVLYNFMPLFLSILFFKIKRIDPYEVWFKFKYVYLFLIIEIVINILVYTKIFIVDLNVLNKQVLQFVIHLLYYTPIIYYLSRQSGNYSFGSESSKISMNTSNLFFYAFTYLKKPFFYLLIILLLAFNFPLIIFV